MAALQLHEGHLATTQVPLALHLRLWLRILLCVHTPQGDSSQPAREPLKSSKFPQRPSAGDSPPHLQSIPCHHGPPSDHCESMTCHRPPVSHSLSKEGTPCSSNRQRKPFQNLISRVCFLMPLLVPVALSVRKQEACPGDELKRVSFGDYFRSVGRVQTASKKWGRTRD